MLDPAARDALAPFVLGAVQIREAAAEREEWPDTDAFGNPGLVAKDVTTARGVSDADPETLERAYRDAGWVELPRDSLREDDLVRFRKSGLDPADPFLWECDAEVGIGGRVLRGAQRTLLEKKAKALRREIDGTDAGSRRRAQAGTMLAELENGLRPAVTLSLVRRRFDPEPTLEPGATLGEVLPLRRLSQLVYTVVPANPDDRDDEDGEPMYLTILGVDGRQASFLFSGGIHGQRTISDLDEGIAHHAWFMNRRNETGEDTAPWIGRRIYRELAAGRPAEIIVRWERDEDPVEIRRTGEGREALEVDGEVRDVPVLHAETDREDRFTILADPESPLVLRLFEAGADLLRTIDAVRQSDA